MNFFNSFLLLLASFIVLTVAIWFMNVVVFVFHIFQWIAGIGTIIFLVLTLGSTIYNMIKRAKK